MVCDDVVVVRDEDEFRSRALAGIELSTDYGPFRLPRVNEPSRNAGPRKSDTDA